MAMAIKRKIGPSFSPLHAYMKRKMLERKTQKQMSINFFRKKLGFTKPSSMLLDGSFIMHCLENNLRLTKLTALIADPELDLYTTRCVVEEMRTYICKFDYVKLSNFNKLSKELNLKSCDHKEVIHSEECIKSIVGDDNRYRFFLATIGSHFSKNPHHLLPIVTVSRGSFVIKKPSPYQLHNSPQLCSKLSSVQRGIIDDDSTLHVSDPESPEFLRLMDRLKLYRFAQIPVFGDGNCLPRALSEQMTHSESSYEIVRKQIFQQLSQNEPLYMDIVSEFLKSIREVDPEMSELTYDEYVTRISKDKESSDCICVQAAADVFKAKIVCLCSTENIALLEFYPSGQVFERVLYLLLLIRAHADSMYPICTPVSICSHLYPL